MSESLEYDVEDASTGLLERLRSDRSLAEELYAALCNVTWVNALDETWSCLWRSSGAIVAHVRRAGEDYLDFYCGGNEGIVSPRVADELLKLGWRPRAGED